MTRSIEIEEDDVREWTCPKCGGHNATFTEEDKVLRCGYGVHDGIDKSGCGAEFPASEYKVQSVVTSKQEDLLGAAYKLLMEEAARHGAECIVLGCLPGNEMTFAYGTVSEMAEVPFQWANLASSQRAKRRAEK